mgnify:CR=1 FL=1
MVALYAGWLAGQLQWQPASRERKADNVRATFVTPAFPGYVSGHSTFSRSAATVLAGIFGSDNTQFTTTSDGLPGVTRTYVSFSAAADEAGISRRGS